MLPPLQQLSVRRYLKSDFIVGDDRALILAGPIKKDEVGFWTVEKEIVEKLNQEFDEMWSEGTKMHQGKENQKFIWELIN